MRASKKDQDRLGWLSSRVRLASLLGGGVFGLLSWCAVAPLGWWWCSLLAIAPLVMVAMTFNTKAWTAGAWAGVGSLPFWWATHAWMNAVSFAAVYAMAVVMALFVTAFVVMLAWAVRRRVGPVWLVAAMLWCAVEVVRGEYVAGGYAWLLLGHPLIDAGLWLTWPGRVVGQYGVSLLAAVTGAGLATALVGRETTSRVSKLMPAIVVVLWAAVGLLWPSGTSEDDRSIRVAVVQSNIRQDLGVLWTGRDRIGSWQRLRELIVEASGADPDLIVTPESALPAQTLDADALAVERRAGLYWEVESVDGVSIRWFSTNFADELFVLQAAIEIPIIVNALGYTNMRIEEIPGMGYDYVGDETFNSMYLIDDGSAVARYDKLRLTPFGETIPGANSVPWVKSALMSMAAAPVQLRMSEATGDGVILPVEGEDGWFGVAAPICYEATDSAVCRRLVAGGGERRADLMANGTNDGWFGRSVGGREVHLIGARWRCLELATPMARAANTGVSAIIDADGRIVQRIGSGDDGVIVADLRTPDAVSLYAHVGGIFSNGVVLVGLGVVVRCRWGWRRATKGTTA